MQIHQWILEGASEHEILARCRNEWPRADTRPAILLAIDDIAKSSTPNGPLILGFALEATREIYRRMLETGDLVGALRAIKQLVDLARAAGA